jgi:hypothetical protein
VPIPRREKTLREATPEDIREHARKRMSHVAIRIASYEEQLAALNADLAEWKAIIEA